MKSKAAGCGSISSVISSTVLLCGSSIVIIIIIIIIIKRNKRRFIFTAELTERRSEKTKTKNKTFSEN